MVRWGGRIVDVEPQANRTCFEMISTRLSDYGIGADAIDRIVAQLEAHRMVKLGEDGAVSSPISKFFDEASFAALVQAIGLQKGDLAFFGAGTYKSVSDFMGALRLKVGKDMGLVQTGWKPLWVTDFPMFEWDEEEQRYVALHHPFTAPAVDSIDDTLVLGGVLDPVPNNNVATVDTPVIPGADVRIAQKSVTSSQPATAGSNDQQMQAFRNQLHTIRPSRYQGWLVSADACVVFRPWWGQSPAGCPAPCSSGS